MTPPLVNIIAFVEVFRVSAIGYIAFLIIDGEFDMKGGTSKTAPVVASIFTLLNEERLAAGKSPVGFVNPTLYANPQMFNDITIGNQSLGDPCAGWKWILLCARLRPSRWTRGTKI